MIGELINQEDMTHVHTDLPNHRLQPSDIVTPCHLQSLTENCAVELQRKKPQKGKREIAERFHKSTVSCRAAFAAVLGCTWLRI